MLAAMRTESPQCTMAGTTQEAVLTMSAEEPERRDVYKVHSDAPRGQGQEPPAEQQPKEEPSVSPMYRVKGRFAKAPRSKTVKRKR